jgi:hypothetical protein
VRIAFADRTFNSVENERNETICLWK